MGKEKIKKETFPIMGMSCASCASRINKVLNNQEGVYEANVNYANSTAFVSFDPERCTKEKLKIAVINAGYDLVIDINKDTTDKVEEMRHQRYHRLKMQTLSAVVLAIPIMLISMLFMNIP